MLWFQKTIHAFRYFSLKKVLCFLQLKVSYYSYKYLKVRIKPTHPISISIEPTTACNLACPECPSGLKKFTRPTGKLSLALNKNMIDQLYKKLFFVNYYFQGEPFLNPDFLQLIEYAHKKKIYTSTSTNAHFINEEMAVKTVKSGLDRLIISIDGTEQETYEKYRISGKLQKVIESTEIMVRVKKELKSKTPFLVFQFLAVKPNEHQIPEIFELGKRLGIDEVKIKTAQLYDFENGNPLMPENQKYSRYVKQKNGTFKLKGKQGDNCWRMWSGSVLTWDGKVLPCCFDKDAKFTLGDLQSQSFHSIWSSAAYNEFRHQVFSNRSQIEICKNCSEGTKVWA